MFVCVCKGRAGIRSLTAGFCVCMSFGSRSCVRASVCVGQCVCTCAGFKFTDFIFFPIDAWGVCDGVGHQCCYG